MKKWIIILLVPGLLFIGAGLWLLFSLTYTVSNPTVVSSPNTVLNFPEEMPVPKDSPVITMNTTSRNATTSSYLYIYENRTVIAIEEAGTRPDLGRQGFRIWKKNLLSQEEFDNLIRLFKDKHDELNDDYRFPGYSYKGPEGITYTGDMDTYLSINCQGITKTVRALDYLSVYSSYSTGTYAGMPSPLAEICQKLRDIAIKTVEVTRQSIS